MKNFVCTKTLGQCPQAKGQAISVPSFRNFRKIFVLTETFCVLLGTQKLLMSSNEKFCMYKNFGSMSPSQGSGNFCAKFQEFSENICVDRNLLRIVGNTKTFDVIQ